MMATYGRLTLWGAALAAGLILLAGCDAGNGHRPTSTHLSKRLSASVGPKTSTPGPESPTTSENQVAIGPDSLVATINPKGAPGSRTPGGPSTLEVPGHWFGAASVLPVIAQQPGWVDVRLAQRPNGSTAWVPAGDVEMATDSYHMVVDLSTTRLQLFNHGNEEADFPAGVGISADPTPTGSFFIAFFARAPSPGYGAFVIVTSAHSNTTSDWEQSGDAITAIHGPLGSDAAIGASGARVSHGCIRLHDADLAQLRDVPAGTPVDIVD
jgi:lipoprotein-anchoring transpeptidase ErfK/SrfK